MLLWLGLAGACVPPPAVARDAGAWLDAGPPDEQSRWRVMLRPDATARFEVGGVPWTGGDGSDRLTEVVLLGDVDEGHVRVAHEIGADAWVVFVVEARDLVPRLARTVRAEVRPGAPVPVTVGVGAAVDVLDESGGLAEVRVRGVEIDLALWVPGDALVAVYADPLRRARTGARRPLGWREALAAVSDPVIEPLESANDHGLPEAGWHQVGLVDAGIRATVDAEPFAWLDVPDRGGEAGASALARAEVVRVGGEALRWVVLDDAEVHVEGWVPASAIVQHGRGDDCVHVRVGCQGDGGSLVFELPAAIDLHTAEGVVAGRGFAGGVPVTAGCPPEVVHHYPFGTLRLTFDVPDDDDCGHDGEIDEWTDIGLGLP